MESHPGPPITIRGAGRTAGISRQYLLAAFLGNCAQRKIAGGAHLETIAESASTGVWAPSTTVSTFLSQSAAANTCNGRE